MSTVQIDHCTLMLGDCLERMKALPDNSVDAIVTDPPYGLNFMNSHWDYDVPSVEIWQECLRVLKPGGHLLSFSGSRTYHRMVVTIEDAGFEIRDQVMWVYGSGFPKSLDVSKAIDKVKGVEREVVGQRDTLTGSNKGSNTFMASPRLMNITVPTTDAAKQWHGWGSALKPAHEPICLARKPLIGTLAENVLTHGVGGLNIDSCRVSGEPPHHNYGRTSGAKSFVGASTKPYNTPDLGRWPANFIHDGSDEVVALFPQSSITGKRSEISQSAEVDGTNWLTNNHKSTEYTDAGSAARFFYCAKASKQDRGDGNNHPTVKPANLMRYLCRLITPPNGMVLDPFAGSGSTGKAATLEGFKFIGIEKEPKYFDIACQRIREAGMQTSVFDQIECG